MLLNGVRAGTLIFAAQTVAHMALEYPAPFNASNNPHRTTAADNYLEYPYECCGPNDRWQYPCRGYHKLLGTPEGAPTATWEAGTTQNWNISGIGNHFGGSCQVGFSTDKGETFRVATSYEGNCPHRDNGNGPDGQDFKFKVPSDIEPGVQIFAWIWYNREQEVNMNCAAVEIIISSEADPSIALSSPTAAVAYSTPTTAETTSAPIFAVVTVTITATATAVSDSKIAARDDAKAVSYTDRPLMFVADDGNGCLTPHTNAELKYPDPGPDVVQGDSAYPLELPVGDCDPSQMLLKQAYDGGNGNDGDC